jgi:hypothetical protein
MNTILDGIVSAQKDYAKWSGGEWLWNAPEYMLNIYMAQKISKIDGAKYITLENSAKGAMSDAGARGKGRLHSKIRENGRFDALLWWGGDTPRAVIEIKNQISSVKAIEDDLHRISHVLQRNSADSSFQFGVVAYYTSCRDSKEFEAKERLKKRLENISNRAKNTVGNNKIVPYSKKIRVDGDSAWVAAALLIK